MLSKEDKEMIRKEELKAAGKATDKDGKGKVKRKSSKDSAGSGTGSRSGKADENNNKQANDSPKVRDMRVFKFEYYEWFGKYYWYWTYAYVLLGCALHSNFLPWT